jgi:erythromycin esterase
VQRFVRLCLSLALTAPVAGCGADGATEPEPWSIAFADATDWLGKSASPLRTPTPSEDVSDLEPLRRMVGSARLVGLGEATHGTREFFQLKHRIVQFLVQEMGFTLFGIEATWPEANDLNRYVLTGEGDPAHLLANLYFWTWNTQEVLDMVLWMRAWNARAPADRKVQFLGFDMQFPGAAMDSVLAFVRRVAPSDTAFVTDRYACLSAFRNRGAVPGYRPPNQAGYAAQPFALRADCRRALTEVHDRVRDRRAPWTALTSGSSYAAALQSARVVQQWEQMADQAMTTTTRPQTRDYFMAENTIWLLNQAGSSARVVLWAHNGHVANRVGWMGSWLRISHNESYVNLGFLFGRGGFNAVGMGSVTGLRPWTAEIVLETSYEAAFVGAGRPLLLLDARLIPGAGAAARALGGPLPMRSIGAVFDPAQERQFYTTQTLPNDFDMLLFVGTTSPSVLLPFR